MNSFYTSVNLIGNNLFYIGYENNIRIQRKFKFSPTLYVVSNKPTKWKTLDGRYAKPIQFDTVGDARDFKDKYKDCLLYTSPSPRDSCASRMPSSA